MLTIKGVLLASLYVASLTNVSDGARILGVFPFPSTSHMIVFKSLMRELALRGHQVTIITSVRDTAALKNYKEIFLGLTVQDLLGTNTGKKEKFDLYSFQNTPKWVKLKMLMGIGKQLCEQTLSNPNLEQFMHAEETFDLVIIESFLNECLLGFAHKYQAPVMQISSFGLTEWLGNAVGNPHSYAYMPDHTLEYSDHMTILQRLHNTLLGLAMKLGRTLFNLPEQNSIMQRYFDTVKNVPLPHASELYYNTSLILLNSHVSTSGAKPYLPNIVEVGGMHIKSPKKLQKDLKKFLDSATEGVIYFSMGSNLKSADMPVQKRDALLQAFAKLKQKVLWKWEDDVLPGQPKNVKLMKWLPQSDLLAHPNIKLFITHGGLLSTQEALYHGIPVVGIPVFGDQQMNMKKAEKAGYGYLLDFYSINSSEPISKAIGAVLNDPKYRENAQQISRIFRDQPRTPLETAVFWTEYVIRHKGAHHLRSAALDLTWYQYYLLDVLGVIAGAALIALLATYLTLRTICRCIFPKKKATQSKENIKKMQ